MVSLPAGGSRGAPSAPIADGLRRLIQSVVTIALLSYAGLVLVLWLLQERMIFFPQPLEPGTSERIRARVPGAEEVVITAADGTRLRGWLRHPQGAAAVGLVIYFGGNAEEIGWLVEDGPWPREWAVALVNYRGYGASEGRPGERELFADALAIHDTLVARSDLRALPVVVFGRSLGSGVAVYLAGQRAVAGVVLVSPYDSVRAVASRSYPWVPVGWLLRHPFDSLSRAGALRMPLLVLIAAVDQVVPPVHSRRLLAAWGGPRRSVELAGADHADIAGRPEYAAAIREFLADLAQARGSRPDQR